MPVSWHCSQVLPVTANINVCLAEDIVVPLKEVKTVAVWQFSHGVAPLGMCAGDSRGGLGREVIVIHRRAGIRRAVAGDAAAGDPGVQYGIRRQVV